MIIIKIILYLILAYSLLYLWYTIRRAMNDNYCRSNQKHKRLIRRKYFRVYYSGAYAWLELDFGRTAHGEFVLVFGCTDRFMDWKWHSKEV